MRLVLMVANRERYFLQQNNVVRAMRSCSQTLKPWWQLYCLPKDRYGKEFVPGFRHGYHWNAFIQINTASQGLRWNYRPMLLSHSLPHGALYWEKSQRDMLSERETARKSHESAPGQPLAQEAFKDERTQGSDCKCSLNLWCAFELYIKNTLSKNWDGWGER